ncbi:MAG: FHA domain-containing protein [Myxococcota bacterium]
MAAPAAPAPGAATPPADGQTLAGFIYSFQDDPGGQHWVLFEGENLVGRAETSVKCGVPIAHGTTSTRHAQLLCNGGQVSVMDLKSTNGTYVNGRRIDPNVATPLNDGDKVRFGGYTVFILPARQRA